MARMLTPAIALGLLATTGSAGAFWLDAAFCHCEQQAAENQLWPQQFVGADRCRVQAPFNAMIQNGWRRQNLLGTHHFSADSMQLTEAGKLRVRWILTQNPVEHRQIFIERSLNAESTQARIEAANEFAALVVTGEASPMIAETHIISEGRPATTVDFVNTTFRENMPIPTLPDSSTPGVTE